MNVNVNKHFLYFLVEWRNTIECVTAFVNVCFQRKSSCLGCELAYGWMCLNIKKLNALCKVLIITTQLDLSQGMSDHVLNKNVKTFPKQCPVS